MQKKEIIIRKTLKRGTWTRPYNIWFSYSIYGLHTLIHLFALIFVLFGCNPKTYFYIFKKCNYKPLPIMFSNYRYRKRKWISTNPNIRNHIFLCLAFVLEILYTIHNPMCVFSILFISTLLLCVFQLLFSLLLFFLLNFGVAPQKKFSTKLEQEELTNSNLLQENLKSWKYFHKSWLRF